MSSGRAHPGVLAIGRSTPPVARIAAVLAVGLAIVGTILVGYGLRPRTPPGRADGIGPAPALVGLTEADAELPSDVGTDLGATRPMALTRSVPIWLDVPSVGLHAPIVPVGRQRDGSIEVPPARKHGPAGWYRLMAGPGEPGPAVIVGHVDSASAGPAVFYRLGALRAGDRIILHRRDSRLLTFSVVAVARYPRQHFPAATVYGRTSAPTLRLITCGGSFDRASGHYRDNVVVFARLLGRGRIERSDRPAVR